MPWTTIRVDRDVNERIKELAAKEGVSVREFLKRLVEGMEEEKKEAKKKQNVVRSIGYELERYAQRPLSPEEWELSECYWELKRGYERWLGELDRLRKAKEEAQKHNAHPTTIARLEGLIILYEDQQRKITSLDDYVVMIADFLNRKMNAPNAAERLLKLWERCKEWHAKLI